MSLRLEAFDPHSGIHTVQWTFGESKEGTEFASGNLTGKTLDEKTCPPELSHCYCPNVGKCEVSNYTIPLNKLVALDRHNGDHNRNYYFKIKVTNNAMLVNTEHVDILVDDSPPEPGTVKEGPVDSPDIDYTSAETIMVNWHGFVDHESGIKMYRIGLARHCLNSYDLYHFNKTDEIAILREALLTENAIRMEANFTGKMYVTVIAINNAMDPSVAVCSDGISRDISPPEIRNVTIQNGKWSESIVCENGLPWLMHSSLRKIKLHNTKVCIDRCLKGSTSISISNVLVTEHMSGKDKDISEFMCEKFPSYSSDIIIYIPNDHIYLTWGIIEDGSQVNDYLVGFGTDKSDADIPDIISFQSTNKKRFFKHQHIGIGSDSIFFIFIKTVNKAGLESITTLGPILIDATPPRFKEIPQVTVQLDTVMIGWSEDTFYDIEQKSQINQVFFKISQDDIAITPLLEWRLDSSKQCSNFSGGCFEYPVRKLQQKDTATGVNFYITMSIYNNAGHFTKIKTKPFKVPSMYPPGHAVVVDIDPEIQNENYFQKDINIHFTEKTLCSRWSGFKHHEYVRFEAGIGHNRSVAGILPFQLINDTTCSKFCVESDTIETGKRYFVLIRAICSGGVTISASNGITIITDQFFSKHIQLNMGKPLSDKERVFSETIALNAISVLTSSKVSLTVGKCFQVHVKTRNVVQVGLKSTDAHVISSNTTLTNKTIFTIIPYKVKPVLTFLFSNFTSHNQIEYEIYATESYEYVSSSTHLAMHWIYNGPIDISVSYEASLVEVFNNNTKPQSFVKKFSDSSYVFSDKHLIPGKQYYVGLRACSALRCLSAVSSNVFQTRSFRLNGNIQSSVLDIISNKTCVYFHLNWNRFTSETNIMFYQWAITLDREGMNLVTDWETEAIGNKETYKISQCLTLPVKPYTTLYSCVRAFAEDGQHALVCTNIQTISKAPYKHEVIYEFDVSKIEWRSFQKKLQSSNIGDEITSLHNAELDFGIGSSRVACAMLNINERIVNWFLMTSPHVPLNCDADDDCKWTDTYSNGYVVFEPDIIKMNTFYFTCAFAHKTYIERETFTEEFDVISVCSNGFILDDTPPQSGGICVVNETGFIIDTSRIAFSWDSFTDNVDATRFGYIDRIKMYSYAIGSREFGDDIKQFTSNGLSTSAVERNLGIKDGSRVYVTVKAMDHSGLSSMVSSEVLMVDISPPIVGTVDIVNQIQGNHFEAYVKENNIFIICTNFVDNESGLAFYEVGVGSRSDIMDVMKGFIYYDDYIQLHIDDSAIHDGHTYYIIVKAVNRAGLMSTINYVHFKIDKTKPTGGHVSEGHLDDKSDVDFQENTNRVNVFWKGFIDPHSDIHFYRIGLGSSPFYDDVEPMMDIALRTDVTWFGPFVPGKTYYTTVEACNGADLCHTVSSDGITLDNSPPIAGRVHVGSDGHHLKYHPQNNSIHIQWTGFHDPHSQINRFEACIGTGPFVCDIVSTFDCLLQSNVIKTGLNLPSNNTKLYATVTAYNNVGLFVSKSSDDFMIDISPPAVVIKPRILVDFNKSSHYLSQWEKSVLRVSWQFKDVNSPIERHIVSLVTHDAGHLPLDHIETGLENTLTINLDGNKWLHSGDRYTLIVTCCNIAGLCVTERSDPILIDSTPPHTGGFMPPMVWENHQDVNGSSKSTVSLKWYGFNDPESGIDKYFITVGSTYNGLELSNSVFVKSTNAHKIEINEEATILLNGPIYSDDTIVLSIWAMNGLGLNSTVAKISVNALSTSSSLYNVTMLKGVLEIEKHSCDVHFCNKDCTCAVVGKPCVDIDTNFTCNVLNATSVNKYNYPVVNVFSGLAGSALNITPSSACLSGHWTIPAGSLSYIKRFEWSMGLLNQPYGEGIFDLKTEQPWHDVDMGTEVVHCLPVNRSLIHGETYQIYVRTWYSRETSAIFESNAIKIDQSPPQISRGKYIKDSDVDCKLDFDVIDWMDTISACWEHVFLEQQGEIVKYSLSLGTSARADDIFEMTTIGLNTNITLTNVTLTHGTRYYFTVTAYNNAGLHSSLSSDGFIIDMDNPVSGVVFNTERHADTPFQSSTSSIGWSWHGYFDNYSGIKNYFVAVVKSDDFNMSDIKFINVGTSSHYMFTHLKLEHNKTYYGLVKAVDGAGHVSNVSISRGKTIDTTPPELVQCNLFQSLFNESKYYYKTSNVTFTFNFELNNLYRVSGDVVTDDSRASAILTIDRLRVRLPLALTHDGTLKFDYKFISPFIGEHIVTMLLSSPSNGSVGIILNQCVNGHLNDNVSLVVQQKGPSSIAVDLLVLDEESSLNKRQFGIGSTHGGYQFRPMSPVSGGYNGIVYVNIPHGSPVHVTAIADNKAGLRSTFHSNVFTMDHTPPTIRNITIDVIDKEQVNDTFLSVNITTNWRTEDFESDIAYCLCALGTESKDDNISPFGLADNLISCSISAHISNLQTHIHAFVKCVNKVELVSSATTSAFSIASKGTGDTDLVNLHFENTDTDSNYHIGQAQNASKEFVQANMSNVIFQWPAFHDESGIDHYEYRLSQGSDVVVDWSECALRQMVSIEGLQLQSGKVYTAEVKATSLSSYTSKPVTGDLLVCSSTPQLSGTPAILTLRTQTLHLDWKYVFTVMRGVHVSYSVLIGSRPGYNDIDDVTNIRAFDHDVFVSSYSILTPKVNENLVEIKCSNITGHFKVYKTSYKKL